ncbi:MAG: AGE family epimerase/isomerase [Anaerobacillus sp.]|uniref:AGE family epimerase/isomerase n=1 Tax=Anaerobacillus sp. TaxID=1872506 RepID=UPI00391B1089
MTVKRLEQLEESIEKELEENILPFWKDHTVDDENGGFYGYITHSKDIQKEADKGGILNSRILWTFSKAFNKYQNETYLEVATKAYEFLMTKIYDREHSGLYWMVDYKGEPKETRKHIYSQAFGIYGLTEYYIATKNEEALKLAITLYELIEKHAYDQVNKGYFEAYTREWQVEDDLRLSGKDMNSPKSMNTHLHILEAYTNLYRVWKNEAFKEKFLELIEVSIEKIVDNDTFQFKLFFDAEWNSLSNVVSYGHDIEGSWLLYEAAEVAGDQGLLAKVKSIAIKMAEKVLSEGMDTDGSLLNESKDGVMIDTDKVWWIQAEAMVGFMNAYQLTLDEKYIEAVEKLWKFTNKYMIDHENGEWYWKLTRDRKVFSDMPKVEPWKCPYHNSRFCFEILERIDLFRN